VFSPVELKSDKFNAKNNQAQEISPKYLGPEVLKDRPVW
jgi:hypothetical protein